MSDSRSLSCLSEVARHRCAVWQAFSNVTWGQQIVLSSGNLSLPHVPIPSLSRSIYRHCPLPGFSVSVSLWKQSSLLLVACSLETHKSKCCDCFIRGATNCCPFITAIPVWRGHSPALVTVLADQLIYTWYVTPLTRLEEVKHDKCVSGWDVHIY